MYYVCLMKRFLNIDVNRTTNSSTASNTGTEESVILPDPRILILSVSPDQSSSYIPIMNSIFSAQKLVRLISISKWACIV